MEGEGGAEGAMEGEMEVVDANGGGAPCTTEEERPLVLAEMARLVHIDMKGGPPRPQYLIQLLPLLKQWGATGLLMEWEDMFPWQVVVGVVMGGAGAGAGAGALVVLIVLVVAEDLCWW